MLTQANLMLAYQAREMYLARFARCCGCPSSLLRLEGAAGLRLSAGLMLSDPFISDGMQLKDWILNKKERNCA